MWCATTKTPWIAMAVTAAAPPTGVDLKASPSVAIACSLRSLRNSCGTTGLPWRSGDSLIASEISTATIIQGPSHPRRTRNNDFDYFVSPRRAIHKYSLVVTSPGMFMRPSQQVGNDSLHLPLILSVTTTELL